MFGACIGEAWGCACVIIAAQRHRGTFIPRSNQDSIKDTLRRIPDSKGNKQRELDWIYLYGQIEWNWTSFEFTGVAIHSVPLSPHREYNQPNFFYARFTQTKGVCVTPNEIEWSNFRLRCDFPYFHRWVWGKFVYPGRWLLAVVVYPVPKRMNVEPFECWHIIYGVIISAIWDKPIRIVLFFLFDYGARARE